MLAAIERAAASPTPGRPAGRGRADAAPRPPTTPPAKARQDERLRQTIARRLKDAQNTAC